MIKGSEPPDSPPPPYSSYSGCASPEAYSSDDQKYQPLQHQQGPIIHGHKPPGTRTNYGNPNMGQQQQQHPLLHHNLPPGQHPPPQPYRPDINAYSAPAGTAAGSRVIIAQPHLAGSSRTGEIVVDCPSEPPNSYLALSIVTCLCFSPLLGLIAICFSAASHSAHDNGNRGEARRYGQMALALSIAGILISLIILVALLFFH